MCFKVFVPFSLLSYFPCYLLSLSMYCSFSLSFLQLFSCVWMLLKSYPCFFFSFFAQFLHFFYHVYPPFLPVLSQIIYFFSFARALPCTLCCFLVTFLFSAWCLLTYLLLHLSMATAAVFLPATVCAVACHPLCLLFCFSKEKTLAVCFSSYN